MTEPLPGAGGERQNPDATAPTVAGGGPVTTGAGEGTVAVPGFEALAAAAAAAGGDVHYWFPVKVVPAGGGEPPPPPSDAVVEAVCAALYEALS